MADVTAADNNTYCARLWEDIFINDYGEVFSCCHHKPKVLGNIYDENLADICNGKIIRELRKRSLEGTLECYHDCLLLDKNRKQQKHEGVRIDYNDLKRLKILFGQACHIDCIMCGHKKKTKVVLDYDKLAENVDIIPFRSIDIQGGEPFFIEEAKRFFKDVISKNKKASFITNGLLINEEWAKDIALHSAFLCVSLNAATKKTHELVNRGSRWETVLRNIQRVRREREKHGTRFSIIGHMTIIVENLKEIHLFIRDFKKLGFDSTSFSYDTPSVPDYLEKHPFKTYMIRKRIQRVLKASTDASKINLLRLRLLKLV